MRTGPCRPRYRHQSGTGGHPSATAGGELFAHDTCRSASSLNLPFRSVPEVKDPSRRTGGRFAKTAPWPRAGALNYVFPRPQATVKPQGGSVDLHLLLLLLRVSRGPFPSSGIDGGPPAVIRGERFWGQTWLGLAAPAGSSSLDRALNECMIHCAASRARVMTLTRTLRCIAFIGRLPLCHS